MKIPPVATDMIVSQYTRQYVQNNNGHYNGHYNVHNVVVTFKDIGGIQQVEEVTRIYGKGGGIKEIHPSKKIDYYA